MRWIVDRIEGEVAVIETENGTINIALIHLPEGIKEGSVITVIAGDDEKRRERIKERMDRLFVD